MASIIDIIMAINLPKYKQWYIPVELTNQISKYKDKIKQITYKPSSEKELFKQFASLNQEELDYINKILQLKQIGTHKNQHIQIKILDILIDYYTNLLIDNDSIALRKKRNNILINRIKFQTKSDISSNVYGIPPHTYPSLNKLSFYVESDNLYSEFSIFNNSLLGEHSLKDSELIAPRIKLKTDKYGNTKIYDLDILKIIKLNKHLKNFPTQKLSWQIQFGIKNINNSIKPTFTGGVGQILYYSKHNLLYIMGSALINHTKNKFSPQIELGLVSNINIGKFLFLHQIDIKNNKYSYTYKWQQQINKKRSIFIEKAASNFAIGIDFYF